MLCPHCNSNKIGVLDTMQKDKETYRHKKCQDCGFKFYTEEVPVSDDKVGPLFTAWVRERSRKFRAKQKGEDYEPEITGANRQTVPRKPTSPLF